MSSCVARGPGYKSPNDAIKAPRERLLYTVIVYCGDKPNQPDGLATIDADPESPTYTKILNILKMPYSGDELHHFGWNACSSCCNDETKKRRFLIVGGQASSRIYVIDTIDAKSPKIHKVIEPEEVKEKTNLSAPHTFHCLANGNIMISMLGDKNGDAPGGFLLLTENFEIDGKWGDTSNMGFNYDFWYQPYFNIMVSSEWGSPNTYKHGFNPADVAAGKYGQNLYFWDWKEGKIIKKIDLGEDGLIPLELRFHHNPKSSHGFVAAALSSAVWHWSLDSNKEWQIEKIIKIDSVNIEGWPMPVPSLITDLLVSMDDKFIYFANWFHGDVRQYDITDPSNPKLVGQVWCGGLISKEVFHQGKKLVGGPQMIQLSLDGKRLYVTNSLFSSWDDQFYPDIAKKGSHMLMINCDNEKGGMTIDEKFYVDFGSIDDGRYRAHEVRYPQGDCTSDIWLAE
jgi:selenium-binding protein 1